MPSVTQAPSVPDGKGCGIHCWAHAREVGALRFERAACHGMTADHLITPCGTASTPINPFPDEMASDPSSDGALMIAPTAAALQSQPWSLEGETCRIRRKDVEWRRPLGLAKAAD